MTSIRVSACHAGQDRPRCRAGPAPRRLSTSAPPSSRILARGLHTHRSPNPRGGRGRSSPNQEAPPPSAGRSPPLLVRHEPVQHVGSAARRLLPVGSTRQSRRLAGLRGWAGCPWPSTRGKRPGRAPYAHPHTHTPTHTHTTTTMRGTRPGSLATPTVPHWLAPLTPPGRPPVASRS